MRLLLTGFGPFGSIVDNPTERLARHFHGRTIEDRAITGVVLPTSFARATATLAPLLAEHDAALMLGVAETAEVLRLETVGRNADDARMPDVDGAQPVGPIADGPSTLPVTIEIERIAHGWDAARIAYAVSDSAGAYVCNHTLYQALRAGRAGRRVGFIHVPNVPFEGLVTAIELAISAV